MPKFDDLNMSLVLRNLWFSSSAIESQALLAMNVSSWDFEMNNYKLDSCDGSFLMNALLAFYGMRCRSYLLARPEWRMIVSQSEPVLYELVSQFGFASDAQAT